MKTEKQKDNQKEQNKSLNKRQSKLLIRVLEKTFRQLDESIKYCRDRWVDRTQEQEKHISKLRKERDELREIAQHFKR